jgi:FlaA1/EpsC-like NDP-sugar epimerase
LGSKVVAAAAMHHKLQKVLFSSSDKACNPTNVMGATKLIVERLYTAINFLKNSDTKTAFFSTRFGNVLGSQGSVIPLFCSQIKKGGPVTLTDDRMTRFIMSLKQAAGLLIESMYHAIGGEIFITKMPVVKIIDLARVVIDTQAALYSFGASDIKLKIIGPRPGEKLWEELSTDEEARRIFETDKYLIVTPALISNSSEIYDYKYLKLEPVNTTYHSSKLPSLDLCQIQNYLLENHIISNKLC